MVGAGGHDALSIGGEGGLVERAAVPAERGQQMAGRGLPHARGLVPTGGDDALSVGREGGGGDHAGVPGQSGHADAPVSASHTRAVPSWLAVTICLPSGEKTRLVNHAAMPAQGGQQAAGFGVPHARRVVGAGGERCAFRRAKKRPCAPRRPARRAWPADARSRPPTPAPCRRRWR
jgi:hypothetical protein